MPGDVAPRGADADQRPTAYRLVTPEAWFRIDLDPAHRERHVDTLTRQQFAGVDDAPIDRVRARDALLEEAESSYDEGGIELYLSMMMAPGDVPLSSSLLVSYTPAPSTEPPSLADVAGELGLSRPGSGLEVVSSEVAALPVGMAIRRLAYRRTGPEGDEVVSLVLDWHVPLPRGRGALLSLSFATPLLTLEEALVPMFDAVAETLRFAPQPTATGPRGE